MNPTAKAFDESSTSSVPMGADASFQTEKMEEDFDMDKYEQELFEKLIKATKFSNALPKASEFALHSSTLRGFKPRMEHFGHRIVSLTQALLQQGKTMNRNTAITVPLLTECEDSEEVLEQFDNIVDVVDTLLDRVDAWADETKGDTKQPKITISQAKVTSSYGSRHRSNSSTSNNMLLHSHSNAYTPSYLEDYSYNIITANNIPRVQLTFDDAPIDNSNTPFRPKHTSKPNALKPFGNGTLCVCILNEVLQRMAAVCEKSG
jgi:exosome complex exonuclease RRP6